MPVRHNMSKGLSRLRHACHDSSYASFARPSGTSEVSTSKQGTFRVLKVTTTESRFRPAPLKPAQPIQPQQLHSECTIQPHQPPQPTQPEELLLHTHFESSTEAIITPVHSKPTETIWKALEVFESALNDQNSSSTIAIKTIPSQFGRPDNSAVGGLTCDAIQVVENTQYGTAHETNYPSQESSQSDVPLLNTHIEHSRPQALEAGQTYPPGIQQYDLDDAINDFNSLLGGTIIGPHHLTFTFKHGSKHRVSKHDLNVNSSQRLDSHVKIDDLTMSREAFRMFRRWLRPSTTDRNQILSGPSSRQRFWQAVNDQLGYKKDIYKEWLIDLESLHRLAQQLEIWQLVGEIEKILRELPEMTEDFGNDCGISRFSQWLGWVGKVMGRL